MSRTESTMVQLGTTAPAFGLVEVKSGRTLSRDDVFGLEGPERPGSSGPGSSGPGSSAPTPSATVAGERAPRRGLLIMFLCVHCPYVKHVEEEIARLGQEYFAGGNGPIAMAAIQSNDLALYPQDGPEPMRLQAERLGWEFPYLLDSSQDAARRYEAACTPDFFLFDADLRLAYRGQLDSSRPRRGDHGNDDPVTGADLRRAMDAVIAGKQPDTNQRSSIGCNIKWKAG